MALLVLLLEVLCYAAAAVLLSRFGREPWKGRALSVLKAWFTVRVFWLLLAHPVKLEDGSHVVALRLIADTLAGIDATHLLDLPGAAAPASSSSASWPRCSAGACCCAARGSSCRSGHVFGSFLIGRFIGTFLPSTAGLDGYTLYDAARFSGRTVEVTAAKFLEKVIGITGIFLSFLVALPFGDRDVPRDLRRGARRPGRGAEHRALRRDRGRAARAALVPRPRAVGGRAPAAARQGAALEPRPARLARGRRLQAQEEAGPARARVSRSSCTSRPR